MDVLHTAVWVNDVEAMIAFYCDVLGLERSRKSVGGDGITNYFLSGESEAELQFKYDDSREIEPAGIDHIAIAAEDVDATVATVVEDTDSEVITEPTTVDGANIRIAFVTDPQGYAVELVEYEA